MTLVAELNNSRSTDFNLFHWVSFLEYKQSYLLIALAYKYDFFLLLREIIALNI